MALAAWAIEAGMVMAALGTAWGFLKGLPKEIWYALLALLVVFVAYQKGASDEGKEWEARLEKAVQEAALDAERATNASDEGADERAEAFAATQAALQKELDDAKSAGANPLDALVDSLRP